MLLKNSYQDLSPSSILSAHKEAWLQSKKVPN